MLADMAEYGNASEETLRNVGGGAALAPFVAPFTSDVSAVQLSATPTNFAAGFTARNNGSVTQYLGPANVTTSGATMGIPLPAGTERRIGASDASKWWAVSAASCAGQIFGTVKS